MPPSWELLGGLAGFIGLAIAGQYMMHRLWWGRSHLKAFWIRLIVVPVLLFGTLGLIFVLRQP